MPYTPTLADINAIDAQNSGGSYQPTLADINAIESQTAVPMVNQPMTFGQHLTNALNNLGQGGLDVLGGVAKAGMGLANTPHNFVNLFSPRIAANIPMSPITGSDIDQLFGTQNAGLYGRLLENVGQYAPYALGGEALGASGLAGQGIIGATYGATQSQNPLTGAATGAVTNAALSMIPNAISLTNYLKPGAHADQIIDQLSGGRSLEENAQSLAQDVRNSFETKANAGSALYNQIFNFPTDNPLVGPSNILGNSSIYEGIQPFNSAYKSLDKDITDNYDRNLMKLNDRFLADPSLLNAHNLQSQLGSVIRQFQDGSGPLTKSERNELQAHQTAQNALQSDIDNFLTNKNPQLANQYDAASQYWASQVAPYYENNKINSISQGKLTNPANIANIFRNPEPAVQQVVGDLPEDAKSKILYSMLGRTSATKSPENLVSAFKNLDQQGLGSYIPDSLNQQINELGTKIKLRTGAQVGVGGLMGLLGAKSVGDLLPSTMLEPAAVGGGALLGKGLGGILQKILPSTSGDFSAALSRLYPAVRAAVVPNVVGGQ